MKKPTMRDRADEKKGGAKANKELNKRDRDRFSFDEKKDGKQGAKAREDERKGMMRRGKK